MRLRILAFILSVLYGFVLWIGAGYLTGGGHGAMFLAPLALGPFGYLMFFSAGFFHNPDSELFRYVEVFDSVQFCLAVFGWTAMVGLLSSCRLVLRRCFVVLLGLFYLVSAASCLRMALSHSYSMRVPSGCGVLVGGLAGVFVAGQVGLWLLYRHRRPR